MMIKLRVGFITESTFVYSRVLSKEPRFSHFVVFLREILPFQNVRELIPQIHSYSTTLFCVDIILVFLCNGSTLPEYHAGIERYFFSLENNDSTPAITVSSGAEIVKTILIVVLCISFHIH